MYLRVTRHESGKLRLSRPDTDTPFARVGRALERSLAVADERPAGF